MTEPTDSPSTVEQIVPKVDPIENRVSPVSEISPASQTDTKSELAPVSEPASESKIDPTPEANQNSQQHPPSDITFNILKIALPISLILYFFQNSPEPVIATSLSLWVLLFGLNLISKERNWLLNIIVLTFSLLYSFRASPILMNLNLGIATLGLIFLVRRPTLNGFLTAPLTSYILNIRVFNILVAPFQFLSDDIRWSDVKAKLNQSSWTESTLKLVVIGLPLFVIFTLLFMSADEAFSSLTKQFLASLFGSTKGSGIISFIFYWAIYLLITLSLFRAIALEPEWSTFEHKVPKFLQLKAFEVAVIFGSLAFLFIAFILVQFQYLFGGSETIRSISTLTYSEYARSGFFELVKVILLLQAVLLIGAWVTRNSNSDSEYVFRIVGAVLILLSIGVFYSAFYRMALYIDSYGITELRFYSTVFMMWLLVSIMIFLAHLVQPTWTYFSGSYLLSFVVFVLALNFANPDGMIAGTNLNLYNNKRPYDIEYLLTLSADANSQLVQAQPKLDSAQWLQIQEKIAQEQAQYQASDWRGMRLFGQFNYPQQSEGQISKGRR
ncbi:hypothetical protein TI05_12735 [Achromatium sp. WMS3]|nr:hypothetical protein TI05_12735 [Achromatium sp. WMS3]